jgi:hypothetical protein
LRLYKHRSTVQGETITGKCCTRVIHSMGTCAAQLTCLRKVCGHVTVSDHRLSKPEGFNVSLYVVVIIANEDNKLQTPADLIPLYARKK